ncbi:hypothetical protein CSB09_04475 [Candidatus Gracilibacteria bacterium]|nr:MAG: hypothetical protein CSB09_04475 [Candidatus Gracilibacteria bacterium]
MPYKKRNIFIIILTILGMINAFYLSSLAYDLVFAAKEGLIGMAPCDINDTLSCSGALSNPRVHIFGIPFPMIAAVVYPILFILSLIAYFRRNLSAIKIITVMAFGGLAFNGYIMYQEYMIGAFCPLCLMCTGYIFLIAVTGASIWKESNTMQK